jgi:hypothetical protein
MIRGADNNGVQIFFLVQELPIVGIGAAALRLIGLRTVIATDNVLSRFAAANRALSLAPPG